MKTPRLRVSATEKLFQARFAVSQWIFVSIAVAALSLAGTASAIPLKYFQDETGVSQMIVQPDAPSATSTWTGGGSPSVNWSVGANWGGTAPTSAATTDLIFAGTTNTGTAGTPLNQNIATPFLFNSITFSSGGGAFFLGGGSLGLNNTTNTITQSSSSNESIANAITHDGTNTTHTLALAGNGTGVVTLSGNITKAMGNRDVAITKSGTSTFVLSGTSNYDGAVSVSGGILNVQSNTGLGSANGGVTVSSGATLQLQNGITVGAEALNINGTGATGQNGALVNVSGTNTYGGALTLAGATTVSSDSGTLNLTGAIGGATFTLTLTGAGNGSISGAIGTTTGGLIKNGAGTWTLSGTADNTYTGATTVNIGELDLNKTAGMDAIGSGALTIGDGTGTDTVKLLAANQISDSSDVTVSSSGVFNLNGNSDTIDGLSASSAAASVTLGAGTLTVGANNQATADFGGVISGTGGFTKSGSGIQTLSGTNTYSGATSVSAGVLRITNNSSLGATAAGTSVTSAAALQVDGTAGDLSIGAEALTLSGSGVASTGALRNIAGNNSWAGLLTLGAAATISSDAGSLSLTNTGTITGATFTLTLTGAGNGSIAGVIGTTSGGLVKSGTGTWTLSGTAANTYTGTTTVNGGELDLNKTAGVNAIAGNITIGDGSGTDTLKLLAANQIANTSVITMTNAGSAVLNLNGNDETIGGLADSTSGASGAAVQLGAGILTFGDATNRTFGGVISGSGGITKQGASTQTLTGSNSYLGTTTISAGTLQIGSGSTTGTLGTGGVTDNAALTFNRSDLLSVSNIIGGTGSLTQAGAGTLTLSGANSYSGLTLVSAGTLILNGSNSSNGATTVNSSTVLELGAGANGGLASGLLTLTGTLRSTDASARAISNALSFGGNATFGAASTGALTVNGTVALGATRILTITSDTTFTNAVSGSGFALTKLGAATLTFSGTSANTYNGLTTVSVGELDLGKTAGVNAIAASLTIGDGTGTDIVKLINSNQIIDSSDVTMTAGGTPTLDLNGNNETIDGLTSTNTSASVALGAGTLTVGASNGTSSFAGIISGSGGSFIKSGSGTQTLSGANTYSGGTTLTTGTLQGLNSGATNVLQSFGTGALNLNAGTLELRANGSGNNQTIVVGNNVAVGGTTTIDVRRNSGGPNNNTFSFGTLSIGANQLNVTGANSYGLSFGATSLTGNAIFNPTTADLTLAGAISGAFSLTKSGAGTLTLGAGDTNANTYSGLTTVSGGTLTLNKANGTNAIAGNVSVTGGTLSWNHNDQINDSSSITMSTGAINLSGFSETITNFTNSGGTFTTGTNGHLTGTGTTVTWSGGTNTVNSGGIVEDHHIVISGGTNTVQAGGQLKISSGGVGVELNGGALRVDGSVVGGNTTVNSGGNLSGVGTFAGLVNNAGTVRPGETTPTPGTMTVSSFTQASAGTLLMDIAGTAPGQFSVLSDSGNASLAGILNVFLDGFTPLDHDTFRILLYSHHTGVFNSIITSGDPFPGGFFTIAYHSIYADLIAHVPSAPVPDGGSTVVLLGLTMVGLFIWHRKLQTR